jgi:DMSO/TMAO reductase YedYZ heme-binding membrane subunit
MSISVSGVAAYLLLWAGTISGVAVSTDALRRRAAWLHAPAHETLSLAALGVSLVHASQSVLTPQGSRWDLLRFAGPDVITGWGLFVGVLALYLTAAATAAFYLRRHLGAWWRPIHALSYGAYGGAVWHAVAIGANAWLPLFRWFYVGSIASVAVATALRVGQRTHRDVPTPT